jgi:hypothetical protein
MITSAIEGVIKEMNLRFTDIGDAVSDDTHSELFLRGVRSSVKSVRLPSGRSANDLGAGTGLGTNEIPPDAFSVKTSVASAPMLAFGDKLEDIYRREAKHPAVADGEDEGSQRSSLTLTTRMLPLVQHVKLERINWTIGLVNLAKMILQVYRVKGVGGITEEDLACKPIIKWAPILPRDREELVNEVAIRMTNDMLSVRHALEMFQDVDDIERELQLIDEDQDKKAARALEEAKAKAAATPQPGASKQADAQAQTNMKKESST